MISSGREAGRGNGGCTVWSLAALDFPACRAEGAGARSNTRWCPRSCLTISERFTTTGARTSMTIRERPGAESPTRNDFTSPVSRSSAALGSRIFTSGSDTTTRFGLLSDRTSNSTALSSQTTKRVVSRFAAAVGPEGAAETGAGETSVIKLAKRSRTVPTTAARIHNAAAGKVRTLLTLIVRKLRNAED